MQLGELIRSEFYGLPNSHEHFQGRVADGLRDIADLIEKGKFEVVGLTVNELPYQHSRRGEHKDQTNFEFLSVKSNWIDAQQEFESFFKGSKLNFVYQFQDARMVMGVNRSKSVTAHGQPADYLVTENGVTSFCEVKSTENETSFALSNIRKPQWNACIQQVAAKGNYWFYIRKEPEGLWYKVPGIFFVSIESAGLKSVKWEHLQEFRYVKS